jgi:pyruvate-ferredoxin/flavodoxin oxidoreductase
MKRPIITIDGNEAVARVAHRVNEVIAIYPITPSSSMGELADAWSAIGKPNIWGTIPLVVELQSEGGAAGAVHGALQTGSLTTTFTASQALSIFGDHSDVMATRATGFALLASSSVQEAHDFALISQAATLEARVPFVHFFEGFRVSHEVNKIEELIEDDLRAMIDDGLVHAHRARALSPDRPVVRGTAQNPDVFFQARETVNPYYDACPEIVQKAMDKFAKLVGRQYHLFDYIGVPDAERVIVMMGCGSQTAAETAKFLNSQDEKVGVVSVHLYRPFSVKHFLESLPASVRTIAVLDRTKEPGAAGEPLYKDVVTAIEEGMVSGTAPFQQQPRIIGGRYGLSSKDFTPAMAKGVFDEMLKTQPKNNFTIGIEDDLTHNSVDYDPTFSIEDPKTVRALFFGLGADGTVGANKNSIKIIGEETENYAQGHFVYDSRKSGTMTTSHLRFGPKPIHAPYEVKEANFVACHQFVFLEKFDVLKYAVPGAVFLLNSVYEPDEVWDHLPRETQQGLIDKKLDFYVIDAYKVAEETGMGSRINTIMQTCFFAISGVLPRDEAIKAIKEAIKKTYGKRGEAVVKRNYEAVDKTLENLHKVEVPDQATSTISINKPVPDQAPEFVRDVLGTIIAGEGDSLPVSMFPNDGTYPTETTRWEKRNIALEIPVWEPDICIQCGKCVFVCPHAVIRAKVVEDKYLADAPTTFKSSKARWKEFSDLKYVLSVAPEDCTGCRLCVEVCPAKDKSQVGRKIDRTELNVGTVKNVQLLRPLFEFSGACAGCGETPYVKLLTQLFGDRAIIANATGCSSIYGGNLPTSPWAKNDEGRGPAWSNSLFEDNAEFGLGMRLTLDKQLEYAHELVPLFAGVIGETLADELLNADQSNDAGIAAQRERVKFLKERLADSQDPKARDLLSLADVLVKKSVWIVGGDGWAYDIGYGGLDHVLAMGRNVNVLVLDTNVYSNTGGQASKATPRAAVAKFAAKGKALPQKDLGMIAMAYGYIYVAKIAMGASDMQTLRAFMEAEAYEGPSLIIAYSHCIAHGYDLVNGLNQQKLAVQSGFWPLYRFNPDLIEQGNNPLIIDSKEPTIPLEDYAYNETRFRMLLQSDEQRAEMLMKAAKHDVERRWNLYRQMAAMHYNGGNGKE